MNPSESRLANRVLIATAVLFAAVLFWLFASSWMGATITGKVWLSLVAGSVFIADRLYVWCCTRNAKK